MNAEATCDKIIEIIFAISPGEGTAADIERVRQALLEYDEYADWGDDR